MEQGSKGVGELRSGEECLCASAPLRLYAEAADNRRGFSVVEALIAASILVPALLAIYSMLPTASLNIDYTGGMARATALVQQRIEQLRNLSFTTLAALNTTSAPPDLPASEEETVSEGNNPFTRRAWVKVSGTAPRREAIVTVIVQWTEPTGTKTLRLDTMVAE